MTQAAPDAPNSGAQSDLRLPRRRLGRTELEIPIIPIWHEWLWQPLRLCRR